MTIPTFPGSSGLLIRCKFILQCSIKFQKANLDITENVSSEVVRRGYSGLKPFICTPWIVHSEPRFSSLNLAQAVLLMCYEWAQADGAEPAGGPAGAQEDDAEAARTYDGPAV